MSAEQKQGVESLLLVLGLAESWGQWELFEATLDYLREAGGKLLYLGPGTYALETPAP